MSRRYTNRHVEAYDADQQAVAAVLPWWYATRMPEPWDYYLWHQWGSAWAELSLDVCHRAYRKHGARLYATHRDANLRDDLQDWLIVKGVEAMADFIPDPSAHHPDRQWAAFLHRRFDMIAPQHFKDVVGRVQTPSGAAAVEAFNRGIRSNEVLDAIEADTGYAVARHALHGKQFESADPAQVVIRLEEVAKQIAKIEREDRRAGVYSTASTTVGQECLASGCDKPSIAKGLCRSHYNKDRRQRAKNCSEEGCVRPVEARGLCSTHYALHRDQAVADGTWAAYDTPPGCSEKGCPSTEVHALGRCRPHYEAHRRATAPPCAVEGCTLKSSQRRGMCSTHYRRWRRARDQGEGATYL